MDPFLHGLAVLIERGPQVAALGVAVGLAAALIAATLHIVAPGRLGAADAASLGLGGWPVPLLTVSILAGAIGRQGDFVWAALAIAAAVLLAAPMLRHGGALRNATSLKIGPPLAVAAFVVASVVLRLAFLADTILPPYFDSVEHFEIIEELRANSPRVILAIFLDRGAYYHMGFHVVAAALGVAGSIATADVMLVLGQLTLALLPLPIYFITKRVTDSDGAAWLSMILAGIGWDMPAHAVNWGKYPALLSLLTLEFTIGVALLEPLSREFKGRRIAWFAVMIASAATTALMHSRSAIAMTIAFACVVWSRAWDGAPPQRRQRELVLLVASIVATALWVSRVDRLRPVFDPYLSGGLLSTLFALALGPPAFRFHSRGAFACLLSLPLMIACLFIPIEYPRGIPFGTVLLDRPFVEMLLWLPLALLAGLGLDGAGRWWREMRGRMQPGLSMSAGRAAALLVLGFGLSLFARAEFRASDCCRLAGPDDIVAIDWAARNLPRDARILIPASRLALPPESMEVVTPSDAGIWIEPLAGLATAEVSSDISFDDARVHAALCDRGVTHVFVGGTERSFRLAPSGNQREWYSEVLGFSSVHIYEVQYCPTAP